MGAQNSCFCETGMIRLVKLETSTSVEVVVSSFCDDVWRREDGGTEVAFYACASQCRSPNEGAVKRVQALSGGLFVAPTL